MKQVWITKHGFPDVLEVRQSADPTPGDGEVLIDVHFSGINFADILARMGIYPDSPRPPCVIGYEISGNIIKVGEKVDNTWIGKKVVTITRFGGYSSKVSVPVDMVHPIPPNVTLEEAAAMPVTYLTAYIMMIEQSRLKSEETVLIHGIGGGVGISAFQLAKIIGADVIGTASGWKHESLRKMGMENLIDYHSEDFVKRTLEWTGGKGVDLVLDPVAGEYIQRSYRCLRPLGKVIFFGFSSAAPGKRRNFLAGLKALLSARRFHPIGLMNQNKGVMGCNLGHLWKERERLGRGMNQLIKWLAEGIISPVVDKVFSFEEASIAHEYIQDHKNIGKVLLSPKL